MYMENHSKAIQRNMEMQKEQTNLKDNMEGQKTLMHLF